MPEVLLPQNFATVNADGEIAGTNVALNYANSILNTGTISAENLTVNTASLTNEQRSTNVGNIYSELAASAGVTDTTGTVVQQGGYMSAANYDMNVQALNQIGGALQQINADGSVNNAATSQLLANLKDQLGGGFTQSTVSNDLQTTTVADQSMSTWGMVFAAVVMTAISIGAAGAASAAIGAMAATAGEAVGSGATFAAAGTGAGAVGAGVGNVAVPAAVGAMANSAMSQVTYGNGAFDLGTMFEAGATAFVTAGLTNGITYGNGALGFTTQASSSSLAALAGVQAVGNVVLPGASAATGNTLQTVLALAAITGIQAGAQSLIEGGSFLTDLGDDAVTNLAAAAAFSIGTAGQNGTLNEAEYLAAHAALGCASSAALGTGCAGGAIGGAMSAGLNSVINSSGVVSPVVLSAIESLVSGSVAGSLGFNIQGAMTAAQNETLNNFCEYNSCGKALTAFVNNASDALNAGAQVPAMDAAAGQDVLAGMGNTALNLAGLSLPGMADFTQYFQYNNPTLGAIGELYGSMGLGALASSAFGEALAGNSASPWVFDTGANITPMSTANAYRSIGANGTFVTPLSSMESIIGPISPTATEITLSQAQATALENALGLNPGSLQSSNVLSIVSDVSSRAPRSPLSGNSLFLGGGQGLPGGGAELVIDSIPSAGGQRIRQITVKVK